jgi:hypothetical protein
VVRARELLPVLPSAVSILAAPVALGQSPPASAPPPSAPVLLALPRRSARRLFLARRRKSAGLVGGVAFRAKSWGLLAHGFGLGPAVVVARGTLACIIFAALGLPGSRGVLLRRK